MNHPSDSELILFDLDGTLIDSFEDIRRSIRFACAAIEVEATHDVVELVRTGAGLEVFFEMATGCASATDQARFTRMVDTYRAHYRESAHNRPYIYAEGLLASLRRERPQTRLAIATSKRSDMARGVMEKCGLTGYFDLVCGTDDLAHKPDPALLLAICHQLAIEPAKATMIGDTDRDIGAAKAAGMTSIGISHGGWPRARLATLQPDYIVDSLEELSPLLLGGVGN